MKFAFQCPYVKFHWRTDMLLSLCIVNGCFPTTVAKESHCKRDPLGRKARSVYHLVLCRKSLLITALETHL